MQTRKYGLCRRWLPYASAALAALLVISGMVTAISLAAYKRQESPETRIAVEERLRELEEEVRSGGAVTLRSPRFRVDVQQLPYAGMALVVDADGEVVYHLRPGQTLRVSMHVSELTSAPVRRLLDSLPHDALRLDQRILLMAGDAIQAEGEHSDIYYYTTRLLKDGDGQPVGVIAVAFDRQPGQRPLYARPQANYSPTSTADRWLGVYSVALPVFGASLALYWLSLPAWVLLDARARGERAWLWAALALSGNLLGVITYLLMRRTHRLNCPGCAAEVSAGHNTCPQCGLRLRPACSACHESLQEGWRFCPRCGSALAS